MTTKLQQVKRVCFLFMTLHLLLLCKPVLANENQANTNYVPEELINLDLCTLAYQLYHQSLCLPLDPWYDLESRVGSDRRNNICRFTQEYAATLGDDFYSGPNAARGFGNSNYNLDPIISNYKYIDAKLPTFNRDGERFLSVFAPGYLTQNIKTIEGIRYKTKPTSYPNYAVEIFPIKEYPTGEDHLVVFEGGTGNADKTDPAWSLMGFVLIKKTSEGHDAHIVFRGSRSGSSLIKTVLKAQDFIGAPKGNPDWITDLRSAKQVNTPMISNVGKVTQGFAEALPTMLGPITICCKYLEQKYPSVQHIYVTGHSLGAGLASQFASSVLQGDFGKSLTNEVKSWPWSNTTLMAYAQPIPGDPAWALQFNQNSPSSKHFWVSGDSVVEASAGRLIGLLIDKGEHSGIQNKLNMVKDCNDNPHEVFVIRAALLNDLIAKSNAIGSLTQLSGNSWGYYENFSNMIKGQPYSYVYPGTMPPNFITEQNLPLVLRNCNFSNEFKRWLEQVYAKMIAEKSSYIGPKFQSTLDERRALVLKIAQWFQKDPSYDNAQDLSSLVNEFKSIDGNLGLTKEEQWIYCAMILSRLEKTKMSLNDLKTNESVNACLDLKYD